jgi:RNA polymerase sigma-70 factor (ECF subfamily)
MRSSQQGPVLGSARAAGWRVLEGGEGGGSPGFVDALRARDPIALGILYDRSVRRVERLLLSIVGDPGALDDLVQQVFLEVLRSLPSLRGDEQVLPAWLDSVVVRVARKAIRQRRRRRWLVFLDPVALPEVPTSRGDPGHGLVLRRAVALLDRLPEEERLCFGLRNLEGEPLEVVARATGLSLATVKRRLERAREILLAAARRDHALAAWLEEGDRHGA